MTTTSASPSEEPWRRSAKANVGDFCFEEELPHEFKPVIYLEYHFRRGNFYYTVKRSRSRPGGLVIFRQTKEQFKAWWNDDGRRRASHGLRICRYGCRTLIKFNHYQVSSGGIMIPLNLDDTEHDCNGGSRGSGGSTSSTCDDWYHEELLTLLYIEEILRLP